MFEVIIPKIEANTKKVKLVQWFKKEKENVKKGEPLFLIETSKAVVEIEAEESGMLKKVLVKEMEMVPILTVVALIGNEDEILPRLDLLKKPKEEIEIKKEEIKEKIKASPAAKRLARENNIDLNLIVETGFEGRVTEEDINNFIDKKEKNKILIIGAGNGGEVVADILLNNRKNEIVGFLDDNPKISKNKLMGKPVLGKIDNIDELYKNKKFDTVIISITSNMEVRRKIFEKLKSKNYKMINAIHPKAYINPTADIGEGNVICAFVHVGYCAKIGNNSLISANSDIEHHNKIGSHILFGPGVMTSGDVTIGDNCSLGTGVNIEPHIRIGDNVAIASGFTIISNVPSNTTLKAKVKRSF